MNYIIAIIIIAWIAKVAIKSMAKEGDKDQGDGTGSAPGSAGAAGSGGRSSNSTARSRMESLNQQLREIFDDEQAPSAREVAMRTPPLRSGRIEIDLGGMRPAVGGSIVNSSGQRVVTGEGYGADSSISGEGECAHASFEHDYGIGEGYEQEGHVHNNRGGGMSATVSSGMVSSVSDNMAHRLDITTAPDSSVSSYAQNEVARKIKQQSAYVDKSTVPVANLAAELRSTGLKRAIVVSELLKRPKLGVAPRYR